jgi:zinc protease
MSAREFETSLKKNNFWLSALKQVYWNGQDPASILKRNERIQALTMKDIIRTANTYLDPDVYVRVVLLPERKSK